MVRITKLSPIDIWKQLPRTNCKECGEESCMAFAIKLLSLQTSLEKCKPLVEDPKYRKNYEELSKLLRPAIREITIGKEGKCIKIGGEYVVHRHELTFLKRTAIAITIEDSMSQEAIDSRIDFVKKFKYEYIGRMLTLDAIAIKFTSGSVDRFVKVFEYVRSKVDKPIVICSTNPAVYEKIVDLLVDEKPLIYAVTKDNWYKLVDIIRKCKCPSTILSPGDLNMTVSLVKTLNKYGIYDICLDPGVFVNNLGYTIKVFTEFRWLACNEEYEYTGYPIVTVPAIVWNYPGEYMQKVMLESCIAAMLITRFANLLIMFSPEAMTYLPLVIQRENYFSDPRKPTTIEPGLKVIGQPNEYSPVLVTCNYALTYSIVTSDLEKGKVNAYVLVIDTEGYAVDVAVAADKFNPDKIAQLIKETGLENKVKHRILIIPGKAARLSGDIEDFTKWRVVVGPLDSSGLPDFLAKNWEKMLKEQST